MMFLPTPPWQWQHLRLSFTVHCLSLPVAVIAHSHHLQLLMLLFLLFVDCCEVVAAADGIVIVTTNAV